jgi:serine/threonine protein phosphatase PrpC
VTIEKLAPDCEFIIIACDGIWDCMSSYDCVNYVKDNIKRKGAKE